MAPGSCRELFSNKLVPEDMFFVKADFLPTVPVNTV